MAGRRRPLQIFLIILALILVGTVVLLSSISFYLSIDNLAYLTEEEVGPVEDDASWNATALGKVERIPRIIHQTWKSETLPDRWKGISQECRDMMPDYEYKLWTDADSQEFIAKEYPWFLDTFDAYTYPIQRADAIRYFVLYHFGGVYLDLDVGCRRRLDRLLVYPVILPKTIPVGVSNDLMFAEKGHPFLAQTIHNLITFDHSWVLNYPTVMFSTGPMFLSAQYGFWTSSHAPTQDMPGGEVRILPKSLYGKNAKVEDVPHSFFTHFYGSSWHADDAAFIGFLGKWGKGLMWIGLLLFIVGVVNLLWRKKSKRSERGFGRYRILLPSTQRNVRWHIDLGLFTLTTRGLASNPPPDSAASSCPSSPTFDEDTIPMLPISFDDRPSSPTASDIYNDRRAGLVGVLSRYSNRVMTSFTSGRERSRVRTSPRRNWQNRRYLFFLPAIFTPAVAPAPELGSRRPSTSRSTPAPTQFGAAQYPVEKGGQSDDLEDASVYGASSSLRHALEGSAQVFSRPPTPGASSGGTPTHAPPPYPTPASDASAAARRGRNAEAPWELWESG